MLKSRACVPTDATLVRELTMTVTQTVQSLFHFYVSRSIDDPDGDHEICLL